MVPVQVGTTPPVRVSVPQVMSTTELACDVLVGTVWHSLQAMAALRSRVFTRWAWCAPTARVVVSVSPLVPTGGEAGSCGLSVVAARAAVPWQEVQVMPVTSRTPFRWVATFTVVAV